MGGKSITRCNRTVSLWKSKRIREIARGSRKNVFVRIRKMSVYDIMTSIIARKGLTAEIIPRKAEKTKYQNKPGSRRDKT